MIKTPFAWLELANNQLIAAARSQEFSLKKGTRDKIRLRNRWNTTNAFRLPHVG